MQMGRVEAVYRAERRMMARGPGEMKMKKWQRRELLRSQE
jgi:hypothetical protein